MKFIVSIIFCSLTTFIIAQDTVKCDGKLLQANVYYGYGAELTHTGEAMVTAKTRTIVVSNLSLTVNSNSLQISVPEDVSLLSYAFNIYTPTLPIVNIKNPKEKLMLDSIASLTIDNRRIENNMEIENNILDRTNKLIDQSIAARDNKTNNLTNDELLKIVSFNNGKIQTCNQNIFEYTLKSEAIKRLISEINTRIYNFSITQKPAEPIKSVGQLTMQVMCKSDGKIPIGIAYFTNNAGWTPTYDIRVNSKNNKIKLVYKASLAQTTGLNWKGVKLLLSTGTANFGGVAPLLTPMYVQLYVPEIFKAMKDQENTRFNIMNSIQGRAPGIDLNKSLDEVVVTGYGIKKKEKIFNNAATTIDPSTLQNNLTQTQSQLNTVYDIDLPYDILSNGALNSVAIKDEVIEALLKNYAVPKLEKDAFLLAEISNWEALDLLYGEANIIMDNVYLGKTIIDPNTAADTLNLSLGRDKRAFVKRTLVKDLTTSKVSGSTLKQTITYEIIVKNNKQTDIDILLKDQYPLSTDKEVEIKLDNIGDASNNDELGILTWKIKLAPGESIKKRFTYTVKSPKDKKYINYK